MRFYFGKERCHLKSEVKRNDVMALKVAPKIPKIPKMILKVILNLHISYTGCSGHTFLRFTMR